MACRPYRPLRSFSPLVVLAITFVVSVSAAAQEWSAIGPWGGPASTIAMSPTNPSRLYVALPDGGVYRSDNGGDSWVWSGGTALIDFGIMKLAVSPFDADEVVAVAPANHVFVSTDAGSSWTKSVVSFTVGPIRSLTFDSQSPGRVFLSAQGSTPILRSDDHGATWVNAFAGVTGSNVGVVATHPTLAGVAFTGSSDGLFRTTDAGDTWALAYAGTFPNVEIAWPRADPDRIYANPHNAENYLHRSDDGGASFAFLDRGSCEPIWCTTSEITADPSNADRLLMRSAAFDDYWSLYETTDAGLSWWTLYDPGYDRYFEGQRIVGVRFDPNDSETIIFACSNNAGWPYTGWSFDGVRRTTDGGTTWTAVVTGLPSRRIHQVGTTSHGFSFARDTMARGLHSTAGPLDGNWVLSGAVAFNPFELHGFGANWSSGIAYESGILVDWDIWWHRGFFYEAGFQSLFGYDPTSEMNEIPRSRFASNPGDGTAIYAWQQWSPGPGSAVVWRSEQPGGGSSDLWSEVGVSPSAAGGVVHPTDPNVVFLIAGGTTGVHESTDGGVTWTQRSNGLPSDIGIELLMRRVNPSVMRAVFKHEGVFETTDAGQSWFDRGLDWGGADAVAACWGPREQSVLVATTDGVFVEGLGIVDDALTTRRFTSIAYSDARGAILLGTERSAAWTYPLGEAVAAPVIPAAPPTFVVFPNPFTDRTMLRFTSGAIGERACLDIYDVQGRLVRRLRTGLSAQAIWDAHDGSGRHVAPGVYLVRATNGSTTSTQRVVHVR